MIQDVMVVEPEAPGRDRGSGRVAKLIAALIVIGTVAMVLDDGPLGHIFGDGYGFGVCAPVNESRIASAGSAVLSHDSSRTVVITGVRLAGVSGLTIVDTVVLERGRLMLNHEFPPTMFPGGINTWERQTQPAIGARVTRDQPVEPQLVIGLELLPGYESGVADGVHLTYRAGWRSYSGHINTQFALTEADDCTDVDW